MEKAAEDRQPRPTRFSNFDNQDSWQVHDNSGNIFDANKPSDQVLQLSSLFSSTNAQDIASVNARIPGGGKTDITLAASATNTPTITIGSSSGTISHLFLDEDASGLASHYDDLGIRSSGGINYGAGASAWVGAGLLNKPIGDFFAGTFNNRADAPFFAANSQGSIQVTINNAFIPEPEEYALVFGLFALGFVFFRRHWPKKRPATATS